MEDNIKATIELTDTYGDEANYSWVKRKEIEVNRSWSNRKIVRRLKKELDISKIKHTTIDFGDMIQLDFRRSGWLARAFITFEGR